MELRKWRNNMWIVTLTKKPIVDDFKSNYFPRKCHYKRDALALVEEVRRKGGDAEIESGRGVEQQLKPFISKPRKEDL